MFTFVMSLYSVHISIYIYLLEDSTLVFILVLVYLLDFLR